MGMSRKNKKSTSYSGAGGGKPAARSNAPGPGKAASRVTPKMAKLTKGGKPC